MKKMEWIFPVCGRILYDIVVLGIISLLCVFLPFASYTYKKVTYVVSGLRFLTGTTILGGTVVIPAQKILLMIMFVSIATMVGAALFARLRKIHLFSYLFILAGIAQMVLSISFGMRLASIMEGAKNVRMYVGIWVIVAQGLLLIVRGFHLLYCNKVLGILDFMVLPGCIYFLINNYFPLFGMFIAFKKIDYSVGIWNSDWVGLLNFRFLFSSSDTFLVTRNTILYNIAFIILGNLLGIIVGIFLNEVFSKKLQKLYQTTILLPQLISIIIVSYIVYAFLSNEAGLINLGILGKENAVNFYNERTYWPFILIFVHLWKGLGYSSIIYLSAIVGIDKSLYEAAYVDGAGRWQQIKSITVPLLKPTVITLVLMAVGRIFYSDFGLFYQVPMDAGALYSVTQTIDTYVYRSLLQLNNIGMASAASVFQSVIGFVVVIAANGIVRKIDNENAMF